MNVKHKSTVIEINMENFGVEQILRCIYGPNFNKIRVSRKFELTCVEMVSGNASPNFMDNCDITIF